MKGFLKGAAVAALVVFIIGIGLTITGAVMGGGVLGYTFGPNGFRVMNLDFSRWPFWTTNEYNIEMDIEDMFDNFDNIDDYNSNNGAPITQEKYKQVKQLQFELGAAEAFVTPGDDFSFKTTGNWRYSSYIDGDKWVVKLEEHRIKFTNKEKVYITFPRDMVFDEVDIEMGAGKIDLDGIKAGEVNFEVGAGQFNAKNIVCTGDAKLNAGMAQMNISGSFEGYTKLDCGMGQIDLALDETPDDYGYDVSVGMGQAKIFGNSYNAVADTTVNKNALVFFKVDVGMGQITIK